MILQFSNILRLPILLIELFLEFRPDGFMYDVLDRLLVDAEGDNVSEGLLQHILVMRGYSTKDEGKFNVDEFLFAGSIETA